MDNHIDKPSVLIIDDEPKLLSSLSLLLEEDFNVLTASQGEEGLKKFKSNSSLSMVMLDLHMPEMNGVETLKAIRAADDSIKVLIMTGKSSHEWAAQCADLNVQGYIKKPFDPRELLARMKKLIIKDHNDFFHALWGDNYLLKMASLSPLVRKAIEVVDRTFSDRIDREKIAAPLKVSPEHLSKAFRKETGFHLNRYITERRIYESKELLSRSERMTISEVACKVGVSDVHYFSRLFKKYAGVSPKAYVK